MKMAISSLAILACLAVSLCAQTGAATYSERGIGAAERVGDPDGFISFSQIRPRYVIVAK